MWKRLVAWHQDWEDEGLAVLENPQLAETLPPGVRRTIALRLAAMSAFERREMREFSLKYRGWRAYAAIGKVFLACTALAVMVHLLYPRFGLPVKIVLANALGAVFMGGLVTAWYNYRWMNENKVKLLLMMFGLAALGNLTGASIAGIEKGRSLMMILERLPPIVLMTLGGLGLVLLPFGVVAAMRNQHYQRWAAQLENDAERERTARELSESRLRMLRAQIEPHFLFNTLGAVQQLAEQGAPRAAELTASLIAFLRASLSGMRNDSTSLGDDFALVAAYLDVMRTRMGERLRVRLDLPPALAAVRVPSMMLLTLVENAIKHGIEPSLRGGEIHVAAHDEGGKVRIAVSDSGVGLSAEPGHGDGLQNIRSRLQLAYGNAAGFSLQDGPDGGAVAAVTIPLDIKGAQQ